ncbi:GM19500 [Drosophila sechellia]|uniref:GM19500 n=1 Tax=Drosophila sechellia TaxID=7238 RepID=B4I623_DROSE|nr:GM19500 [Drosophila sechellia]
MASSTKDGITIRTMTKEDYPSVKAFMKDDFFQSEPLWQSSGEKVQSQNEKENDEYHLSMIAR